MSLKRILQLMLTYFIGQGVAVITQLIVPPLFLRLYHHGIEVYGEWIALSAAISYLNTLNYGIQSYANNQATILYNRGQVDEAKGVQASAVRLLLLILGIFMAAGSVVFFLPVAEWLKLKHTNSHDASLTIYLLIAQVCTTMFWSLLTNSYMVVGKLPRGNNWGNAQRLGIVFATATSILFRAPFPVIAAAQLATYMIFIVLICIDIRRTAPILLPSFRYGSWRQVFSILKPSGHFVLIAIAGFLTWQGPLLLTQRVLGSGAVGVFALVRMVFQFSRQILSVASFALGQDITLLVGRRDWLGLRKLYDLSERVVLFLIPVVSIGCLLICPFLFSVWLHKRDIYDPTLCLLMAIISGVLAIKEHKMQFQQSSNEHEELSLLAIIGYSVMLLISAFTMKAFGMQGFVFTWLAWEIIQTGFIVRLNLKLFPAEVHISISPVLRLFAFMAVAFGLSAWPVYSDAHWPLWLVLSAAMGATVLLAAAAYFYFGLAEVRELVQSKIGHRFAPSS
jgi:O-antigen/teichoic acid export membrane protein